MIEAPKDDGLNDDEPTSENALPEGDSPEDATDAINPRAKRNADIKEMIDAVVARHGKRGPSVADYAACVFELGQLNLMVTKLATGKIEPMMAAAMVAQAQMLTSSIDTKIFTELPVSVRVEAGELAKQMVIKTREIGG